MQNWRRILLPFSPIYGLIIRVRNFLFDRNILKSESFPLPVIGVGNLTVGGTGKTPHVEYLIRLLQNSFKIATVSRGYGRKSTGFLLAKGECTTEEIGDEPMQYYTKFPNITVTVAEERAVALQYLVQHVNRPQVVLMDDAFQHRYVKPGLNILLMEYESIFRQEYLLPGGNLREPKSGANRADIIVITKSPTILVPIEKKRIIEELAPLPHQSVFFSYLRYGEFNKVFGPQPPMLMGASYYMEKRFTILLVTGIANPSGLIEYLRRHTDKLETLIFPDHHEFSEKDILKIQETFDSIANQSKIIVTTEKDAMRLRNPNVDPAIKKLPFFFLPIEVFIHQEEEKFNKLITDYVRKN
ncbi:MAG: tetraacyldisaccharide 4'-kinase [Bacteroidia bacterium]